MTSKMNISNKGKFLCGEYTMSMNSTTRGTRSGRGLMPVWKAEMRIQKRGRFSCDMKGTCYHYDDTHSGKRIFYDKEADDHYVEIKIKAGGTLRVYWKNCERRGK